MWQCLESGEKTAEKNMQLDSRLLENLDPNGKAILHLYSWASPSATYGYFIKPYDLLQEEGVKKWGISLARRPTGGGIVFHVTDLAFSVLVPANHEGFSEHTLANYQYINKKVLEAVHLCLKEADLNLLPEEPIPLDSSCENFCMAKPTIYDVMIGSKKVAGAAQRKRKQGFLHQGSISIALPNEKLLQEVLAPNTKVLESMQKSTYTLLKEGSSKNDLNEIRFLLIKHLKRVFLEG